MSAIPEPEEGLPQDPLQQLEHLSELSLVERAHAFEAIHDHLAQRLRDAEN